MIGEALGAYTILEAIGAGGQAETFLAEGPSGARVVLKVLASRNLESAHALELFERESETLRRLDHPAIPSYVDAFEHGAGETWRVVLAQEFIEGVTLHERLEEGTLWSEEQLASFTRQVLEILIYLQRQDPPIVHRDIKPANLIQRPGGSWVLVDFGAVQQVERAISGEGATFVGTTGYMAPEQFTGRAVPASDLYGLGMTVLHMASGRHPSDFPVNDELEIDYEDLLQLPEGWRRWLDHMIAPNIEDRFEDAAAALEGFERRDEAGALTLRSTPSSMMRAGPLGTRVLMRQDGDRLIVSMPSSGSMRRLMFELAGLVPAVIMTVLLIAQMGWNVFNQLFWLVGVAFIIHALVTAELRRFRASKLIVSPGLLEVHTTGRGGEVERERIDIPGTLNIEEIQAGEMIAGRTHRNAQLQFRSHPIFGDEQHAPTLHFGEFLSTAELRWIRAEVERFWSDTKNV